jgi:membrane-bound lytic murein transglycosylase B
MLNRFGHYIVACCVTWLAVAPAFAQEDFSTWLEAFKQEAQVRGISPATLDAAFAGAQPVPRALELDRIQPEFIQPFSIYLQRRVTPGRIARGQELLVAHQALFDAVEARYGVPKGVLAAFWGLETNYGTQLGGFAIPATLSTLAYDGRRSAFFRAELFDALCILEAGHIAAADMKGSWAGAMGQMQFMPSTFRRYAVDGDADGRIDPWTSLPDALYSAANYLRQAGWRAGEPVAIEVRLPDNFDWGRARLHHRLPVADWAAAGVSPVAPRPLSPGAADGTPQPTASPPQPNPLMEPLAIRLGRQETPAKSLVIPQGDSDFLRSEAREKSYVPQAGDGASVMPKPIDDSLPAVSGPAAIVLPQGWRGPAFMVFDNFDVVMQWNKSVNYVLSVAHLADRLRGGTELAGGQEAEREALSLAQMMRLQQSLDELGFAPGTVDGLSGMRTQSAIRRYQRVHALPVDGHPSPTLLAHVQQAHAEAVAAGRLTPSRALPTFAGPEN